MAVFGSMVMVALGLLISFANNMTEQTTLQQQAFRMALQKAYDNNGSVSYTIIKNYRGPNLFGGFKQGNRQSVSASASVLWSFGEPNEFTFYQINEDLFTIPNDKKIWNVETDANTAYNSTDIKTESNVQSSTNRQATLGDTITTRLLAEDGSVFTYTQGLDTDGRYRQSAAGTSITKGRTWATLH